MRHCHHNNCRRNCHVAGQKPRGCFQHRVKKVGPQYFAIVAVDCGKCSATARVADFYGTVLLEPFDFPISRPGLDAACRVIGETFKKHGIRDGLIALESTGRYHRPIKQAFRELQWDCREVHPYTSKMYRCASDLGQKTDHIDLEAIHRAAVNGLAMSTEIIDARHQQWRVLTRWRRDLVEKAAILKTQLQEAIHAYLPGFTRLWSSDALWNSPNAAAIATAFASPEAMIGASAEQFQKISRDAGTLIHKPMIQRIGSWARQAAPPDEAAPMYHRRACSLWKDLNRKWEEIRQLELDLATFLCQSPAVLLLAFVGINVVSASDYGAELGLIANYACSKSIAGRAGLYPSRYQSADRDLPDGPLVVRRHRQLRAALMRIARNLQRSNDYFKGLAQRYRKNHPKRDAKIVIARSFSRLSYYILAAGQLIEHPSLQQQDKIIAKLLVFFHERHAEPARTLAAIDHVTRQLSAPLLRVECQEVQRKWQEVKQAKRRSGGVARLSDILPEVLLRIEARLKKENAPQLEPSIHPSTTNEDETHGS